LATCCSRQVAHVVPERVVERLEIVEIDEQQGTLAPLRALVAMATAGVRAADGGSAGGQGS
jgi:hypothetical protein